MKNTNGNNVNETSAAAKVAVIKLGQDVHAAHVVVAVQLDGCPPQPAQRIETEKYVGWVKQLKEKHPQATIHSCYEAGPCGYWLHRELTALGVTNYVVAPVLLNGRRKTDKRDARALCEQLDRRVRGHGQVFSAVKVPTAAQEQERGLLRHRRALAKSLGRVAQQGRSALLLQGQRVRGDWWGPRRWPKLAPTLPAWLREPLADLQAQAQLLHTQIRAAEAKIAALAVRKQVTAPYGIGALTWLTLVLEVVGWERFANRRQVASYCGLCPSEFSSGESRRQGGIDKHGNPRVRHALVEAVWRLQRWQPDYPPLARLRAAAGSRARRRAVVAVARRLAIDLWRLATGQTTLEKIGLALDPRPAVVTA
jgi:transposase